jgi:3-phosphoglycerate kinase
MAVTRNPRQCYEELIVKFAESASLRRDYAAFCDIVLNDAAKAESHRHAADLLEAGLTTRARGVEPVEQL